MENVREFLDGANLGQSEWKADAKDIRRMQVQLWVIVNIVVWAIVLLVAFNLY